MPFAAARIGSFVLAAVLLGALATHIISRDTPPLSVTGGTALQETSSPWGEAMSSRVRLVSAQTTIGEGQFSIGIHMTMDEGWKTYWRNPGDSGFPPRFDWSGSQNIKSIDLLWPAPHAFDEMGERYYGYKDEILLPIRLTVEDPAKPVTVSLKLDYGICADVCIPAHAVAEMVVRTGSAQRSAAETLVEEALAKVPTAMNQTGWRASARLRDISGHRAWLEISLAERPGGAAITIDPSMVIVTGPSGTYFGASQPHENKGFAVSVEADAPEALRGQPVNLVFLGEEGSPALEGIFRIE